MTQTGPEWVGIGDRVRQARKAAHLSVRELARRIDVSASHVSQVERGLASFSVRNLYNAVGVLGITMDSLFQDGHPAVETSSEADQGSAVDVPRGPLDEALIVMRAGARPTIPLPEGTRWERLTPKPEIGAEFIEVVYPADPSPHEPAQDFTRHSSREYGLVLKGSLTVQVGFEQTVLNTGDSIAFDSHIPHRFWNATTGEVRAVWYIRDDAVAGAGRSDRLAHVDGPGVPAGH